jgi:hypothetical protein
MNINGVGAPAPATVPVPAPSPTDRAPTDAAKAATPDKKAPNPRAEEEAPKLPPLKGLTVNDVRVMLGMLPVSAARKLEQQPARPGEFDMYA